MTPKVGTNPAVTSSDTIKRSSFNGQMCLKFWFLNMYATSVGPTPT